MLPSTSHPPSRAPAFGLRAWSVGILTADRFGKESSVMVLITSRSKRCHAAKPTVEPLEDRCVLDSSFGPWLTPVNLGSAVNSAFNDQHPAISPNGLSLYITSDRTDLPGSQGGFDIWVSQRATTNGPWGTPVNL